MVMPLVGGRAYVTTADGGTHILCFVLRALLTAVRVSHYSVSTITTTMVLCFTYTIDVLHKDHLLSKYIVKQL